MGEVFFFPPILNKNLSRIFKIHSRFPRITLRSGLVKLVNKRFFFFFLGGGVGGGGRGGGGFGKGKLVFGPPWGGKWY
jgi:hypothetical protein